MDHEDHTEDSDLFDGYLEPDRPHAGAFDEMFHRDGRVRSAYRALHSAIAPTAPTDLAVRAEALGNPLTELVDRDAAAYAAVTAAYRLPAGSPDEESARAAKIDEALVAAAAVPLETAAACAEVADLALAVAERGNTNATSDAGVASLLAEAGCVGASYNVRINVAALGDKSLGATLESDAKKLAERTSAVARRVREVVEGKLVG
jgi:glutamate formiminotransferase/formiminotetrahydrofolate cyclodeaminase